MYSSVENNSGNVPAFLVKLWSLVEDPTTDELISWDTGGTSFHVYDQQRFSREILPLYFKHNNIASFIRQLNMYGFRKVTHIDQGGLKIEKDDLQFQHQFFQKGERDMLQYIKRKVSTPLVRPADGIVTPKSDDVTRVLTDVKQVKAKQDNLDQNLEYIKRENKLLWREVALLRQKHHKQQQIVNKLIQFLVSLVSSNRTGLTIPTMRRMPLAISDNSQSSQGLGHGSSGNNTVASLIQDNLVEAGNFGVSEEAQAVAADYIIDDGDYTIESPRSDGILSPTHNSTGPIIHELTDILPTAAPQQVSVVAKAQPQPVPVIVNTQGQIVSAPVNQKNIILTTNPAPADTGSVGGVHKQPVNFLIVPQSSSTVRPQTGQSSVTPTILMASSSSAAANNNSNNSIFLTSPSLSRGASPAPSLLMSPKIEPAPSLEDALQFGLNVPASGVMTVAKPGPGSSQTKAQVSAGKKRVGDAPSIVSPTKKPVVVAPSSGAQPRLVKLSTNPQVQAQVIPSSQAASLQNLIQNHPELISNPTKPTTTQMAAAASNLSSATGIPSVNNNDDSMALAAAASKDGDDQLLVSEQLDFLGSDLDGLKNILQEQYKVDPNFFMELFDMSNPWNTENEKELEELKADPDKLAASTSSDTLGNITGQELVEYNPQDSILPEDLLIGDSLVGDIDDID